MSAALQPIHLLLRRVLQIAQTVDSLLCSALSIMSACPGVCWELQRLAQA